MIRDFGYANGAPWPAVNVGSGSSIVLIGPDENPAHGTPANWRASTEEGGNPCQTDAIPFTGAPDADDDRDGLNALLEYFLGTSDTPGSTGAGSPTAATIHGFNPGGGVETYLALTFTRSLAADQVKYAVETAETLGTWRTGDESVVLVESAGAVEIARKSAPGSARNREVGMRVGAVASWKGGRPSGGCRGSQNENCPWPPRLPCVGKVDVGLGFRGTGFGVDFRGTGFGGIGKTPPGRYASHGAI